MPGNPRNTMGLSLVAQDSYEYNRVFPQYIAYWCLDGYGQNQVTRLQQNTCVLNAMYYRSIIMAAEALASSINIESSGHKQTYIAFLMRKPRLAHRTNFSMHSNDMICVYVHATWRLYKLLLRSTYLAVNAFTQRNNAPIKMWSVNKVLIKNRSFNACV